MMEMTGMVPAVVWPKRIIPAPAQAPGVAARAPPLQPGVQAHG